MWLIAVGAGLLGVGAIGTLLWIWWAPRLRSQLRLAAAARRAVALPGKKRSPEWQTARDRAATVGQLLEGLPWFETLQLEMLRAGWLLRPSEFVALTALTGLLTAGGLMLLTKQTAMGVVGVLIGAVIPWAIMKSKQTQREKALSTQIPDALDMLCSALRSGFSIARGLELVKTQMHPPISEEFGRVLDEVQFGISLSDALDGIIMRTRNYDLELVVAAVQTQLELGGNLAEILENISDMVRERVKLSGEIAAATAEGKLSMGILMGMPFAIAFLISIVSPSYLVPLFHTQMGWMLLGTGLVLMSMGGLILKKLITIDL